MDEPRRLRVVFDDRKILTKSQKSDGLKRSWVLLKPGTATISDIASHVTKKFKLQRSCPHGVVLSMDDFVLPPFESICLLKDTDIIRINKKDATWIDEIEVGNGQQYIQDSQLAENQYIISSDRLLAIQQVEEDSGQHKRKNDGYLFAHNENAIHAAKPSALKKKRKHSDEIQGSKKKKLKTSSKKLNTHAEGNEGTSENDEDVHLGKSLRSSYKRGSSRIASQLEDNVVNVISSMQREKRMKKSKLTTHEEAVLSTEAAKKTSAELAEKYRQEKSSSGKSVHRKDKQFDRDGRENADEVRSSQVKGRIGRNPSSVIIEQRNDQSEENVRTNRHEKNMQSENDPSTEMEKQIVPVVSRPGHIRFQPSDEEQIQRQSQGTLGTLHWNGTASKKKEQDSGREKTLSKWSDANGYNEYYDGKGISGKEKTGSSYVVNVYDKLSNGNVFSEAEKAQSNSVHFESLLPLARLPQVGDVLAYRLIELSSSWRPQISSFRVGQVKSFNYLSMSIILIPLPEYPISSNEDVEGTDEVSASPYNEDGSLQIHYPSLVEVRLLKANDSVATNSNYTSRGMVMQEISSVNNWELALANSSSAKETVVAQPSDNQNAGWSTWDQIKQTITEKKAQLQTKNGWDEWTPNKSNTRTSWSYNALRGRSAGTTFANSRGRNGRQAYRRKGQ